MPADFIRLKYMTSRLIVQLEFSGFPANQIHVILYNPPKISLLRRRLSVYVPQLC